MKSRAEPAAAKGRICRLFAPRDVVPALREPSKRPEDQKLALGQNPPALSLPPLRGLHSSKSIV